MYHYLALGDSYTCGESIATNKAFPRQLATSLRERGIRIADPHIIAVTGWTTDELARGIQDASPAGTFDLVTLLIGVNNQYRGEQKGYTLDGYHTEFAGLLDTAIQYAGGNPAHVVVLSIPDWGAMPFAEGRDRHYIAADIDAYNAVNRRQAEKAGAQYVDITPISRRAMHDPALVADDTLHPSAAMYALWVEALLPRLGFLTGQS